MGVVLVLALFYLGLVLVLAATVVAVVGAVRGSSGAGWLAGWMLFVGTVLALVTGAFILQALGEIGS
jgi:hypothetical protein